MEGPANKTRISLTQSQLQAGLGAELLALCQSITEDGSISDAGAYELKKWLEEHRSADLPSVEFLRSVVERVIADKIITADQRKALYKAIETVLPPEARKKAVAHRKAVELLESEQARVAREAEKQHTREEREGERPLSSANFMVAGVHYEGRSVIIREYVHPNDQVFLVRDRGNKYSRNAVEVRLSNGYQIGFVPEEDAIEIAPLLDKGCLHRAFVTKVLEGRRSPIPVLQAYIFRPDSGIEGGICEAAVPPKRVPSKIGCFLVVILIVALATLLLFAIRSCGT
ncbi:MAG: HIRAN domain-containing protein [Terriglobia bacterium]|jgi:hypothetical protein